MKPFSLQNTYLQLCQDLQQLGRLVRNTPSRIAKTAEIAPTLKGFENEPVSFIKIDVTSDDNARELAAKCYQDLHISADYSQKCARRTVGALLFRRSTPQAQQIAKLVKNINVAKGKIESHIKKLATRQDRFEEFRASCPGVMAMHVYRQIRCYAAGDVTSLHLFWQQKDLLRKVEKEKLIERIKAEQNIASADYQLPLKQLIARISNVDQERLRIRRSAKVQPAANVVVNGLLKTVPAPMPIILLHDGDVDIKMLESYDSTITRQTRADKIPVQVLGSFSGCWIEAQEEHTL